MSSRQMMGGFLLIAIGTHPLAASSATEGDAVHGAVVYQACQSCHSIEEDDVGPRHRGVFGRRAGTVPGFAYSAALRASNLTWDATTLDQWLANPQALVPGSRMFFSLSNARDRADVIAYLATLRAGDAGAAPSR